jgi:hypothetical protein
MKSISDLFDERAGTSQTEKGNYKIPRAILGRDGYMSLIKVTPQGHFGDKSYPSPLQWTVASSELSWATVCHEDENMRQLNFICASEILLLQSKLGQEVSIRGEIEVIFVPRGNYVTVLNFGEDPNLAANVVIKCEHYSSMPRLDFLRGKKVFVTGVIKEGRNKVGERNYFISINDYRNVKMIID